MSSAQQRKGQGGTAAVLPRSLLTSPLTSLLLRLRCFTSVPRSFRLRQELEYAEKGASMESKSNQSAANNKPKDPHAVFVSFGLGELDESGYDNQLSNWNGTIIGPQNVRRRSSPAVQQRRPLSAHCACADCCCCCGAADCQTNLGERIYNLRIKCGPRYPDQPPSVQFVQKINMPGVDPQTGQVSHSVIMKSWNRNNTMYDYLAAIRQAMIAVAKVKQPGPDERY
jgi:ubiquitin-conjugating enzyme E2 variant